MFLAKISKSRSFDIAKSRSKSKGDDIFAKDKIKDSLPHKIVSEKWRKKKQAQGPGYFQQNRKKEMKGKQEDWKKLSIIPWGGEHEFNDVSGTQVIKMINTCTIDCLLQILLTFYSLHIDEMQRLFLNDSDLLQQKISVVVQHLLTSDFPAAKYIWLTEICSLSENAENILDAFEDDKMLSLYCIRDMFRRAYETSSCSSDNCPAKLSQVQDDMSSTTLHHPDAKSKNVLQQSILEYEQGSSTKARISCKAEFDGEPEHGEFISETDNGRNVVRCAGWRIPSGVTIVKKPPFLLFELSTLFASSITDLSMVPKDIYVYNDHYRLGGGHIAYISKEPLCWLHLA